MNSTLPNADNDADSNASELFSVMPTEFRRSWFDATSSSEADATFVNQQWREAEERVKAIQSVPPIAVQNTLIAAWVAVLSAKSATSPFLIDRFIHQASELLSAIEDRGLRDRVFKEWLDCAPSLASQLKATRVGVGNSKSRRAAWVVGLVVAASLLIAVGFGLQATNRAGFAAQRREMQSTVLLAGAFKGDTGEPVYYQDELKIAVEPQPLPYRWLIYVGKSGPWRVRFAPASDRNSVLEDVWLVDATESVQYLLIVAANDDHDAVLGASGWLTNHDVERLQEVATDDPKLDAAAEIFRAAMGSANVSGKVEFDLRRFRQHPETRGSAAR